MKDYTSVSEKLVLSPRMEQVYRDILPRIKKWEEREATRCSELEPNGANPFLDEFLEHPHRSYVINLANAIVRSWLEMPVVIHSGEAIVGITRPNYPFMEHFSWGIYRFDDCAREHTADFEELGRISDAIERMSPLDEEHRYRAANAVFGSVVDTIRREGLFAAGGYQGHTVPNYHTLLDLGLDGVLEKVRHYKAINTQDPALYEAWEILVVA